MSAPTLLDGSKLYRSNDNFHVLRVIETDRGFSVLLLMLDQDPDDGERLVWRHRDGRIRLQADPENVAWVQGAEWARLTDPCMSLPVALRAAERGLAALGLLADQVLLEEGY